MDTLSSQFRVPSPTSPIYDVSFVEDGVLLKASTSEASRLRRRSSKTRSSFVPYADIVGAAVSQDSRRSSTRVTVYAYPRVKSSVKKANRHLREVKLHAFTEDSQESNATLSEKWKKALLCKMAGIQYSEEADLPKRKFLVLINPSSGAGKAEKIYQDSAAPMFQQAEIETEVIVTERQGHAKDLVQRSGILEFNAIVIVSGDGLHYEVINGLMAREDWAKAITIPIGAIPGGSGNALVCSLHHISKEPVTAICAAFGCVKGRPAPLDILSVHTHSQILYSFLSLTWGLVSDVDVKSESYRWMGNARFTVGFLSQLMSLPKYRGKLHYLPVSKSEALRQDSISDGEGDKPDPHLLSPLDHSLKSEDGWKVIEGDFITVAASLLSHLGSDLIISPEAHLAGGVLYVYIVPGTCSRASVAKMFLRMEEGRHVDVPGTELLLVKAMRLEPELGGRHAPNIMCIDGERIEYGPVQVQVHRALGRVMLLREDKLPTERDIGTPV